MRYATGKNRESHSDKQERPRVAGKATWSGYTQVCPRSTPHNWYAGRDQLECLDQSVFLGHKPHHAPWKHDFDDVDDVISSNWNKGSITKYASPRIASSLWIYDKNTHLTKPIMSLIVRRSEKAPCPHCDWKGLIGVFNEWYCITSCPITQMPVNIRPWNHQLRQNISGRAIIIAKLLTMWAKSTNGQIQPHAVSEL